MSGGWTPSVHLFSQSRGKLNWTKRSRPIAGRSVERERCAGACRGVFGLGAALADGYAPGTAARRPATPGPGVARRGA